MTAPFDPAQRIDPPPEGDERATLTGFLDYQRATLEWKCAGLTPQQLVTRATPPSTMSLLGLLRHLTEVERGWFDQVATGERRPPLYYSTENPDGDFDDVVADPAAIAAALAAWHTAVGESRAVTARTDLGATFHSKRWDEDFSLRWVLTHMIEEYARHNGHADLLREAIDGTTGE